MPKRVLGQLLAEEHVARRIAMERHRHGWSYEALASRMRTAGVPIDQSAIYKVERGTPRRRITTDELVGYAVVFGLSLDELTAAPELAAEESMRELTAEWRHVWVGREAERERYDQRLTALETRMRELASVSAAAREALELELETRLKDDPFPIEVL